MFSNPYLLRNGWTKQARTFKGKPKKILNNSDKTEMLVKNANPQILNLYRILAWIIRLRPGFFEK